MSKRMHVDLGNFQVSGAGTTKRTRTDLFGGFSFNRIESRPFFETEVGFDHNRRVSLLIF